MVSILRHIHSVNRWIVLVLLLVTIITALSKWFSNKTYTENDKKSALFTLIFTHVQFLIGIVLLFVSDRGIYEGEWVKDPIRRFFGMEHMLMMILGVIVITIGYSVAKRQSKAKTKFRTIWVMYGIGLLLILSRVPWPGMHGTSWY